MPDLPRNWIDDPVLYNRAVNSFPGETGAEKAAAYRKWHNKKLKEHVLEVETQAIIRANQEQVRLKREELSSIDFEATP